MLTSRRFILGLIALIMLFVICLIKDIDTSSTIVAVVLGIAGANITENIMQKKENNKEHKNHE